jgi:hypothetical protein
MLNVKKSFLLAGLLLPVAAFGDYANSPCSGAGAMLSLVNRPSAADSSCVAPTNSVITEMGVQYGNLYKPSGAGYNLPEAEVRVGLRYDTELFAILPNFIHETISPHSGFAATTVGVKHGLVYNQVWQLSVTGLLIPSSGSQAFGALTTGGGANIDFSYVWNPQFSITAQFGVVTQAESSAQGGRSYTSANPDLVVSYTFNDTLDCYGELYGQSRTGPDQKSGFNFDGGFIYEIRKNMTVDIEVGQRISGTLGSFSHYVGTGFAVKLG